MAILFDSNGEGFTRSSAILNYNSVYTWMAWIYLTGTPSGFSTIFMPSDGAISNYDNFGLGNATRILNCGTESGNTSGSTTLNTSQWYHVASTRASPTAWRGYLNGVQEVIHTEDKTARTATPTLQEVSNLAGASRHIPGRFSCIKMWDAALSAAEILQEMYHRRPIRIANLNAWYPVFPVDSAERVRDYSGFGRNWTETGTVANADDPPISW